MAAHTRCSIPSAIQREPLVRPRAMQSSAAGSGSVGKRAPKSAARFTGSTVECILIGQNPFCVQHLSCARTEIVDMHQPGVWVRKREEPLPLRSVQPAAQQRWQPCGLTDAGRLDVVERGCVKGRGKPLTASGGWGFPPDRGAPNRDLQAGGRVLIRQRPTGWPSHITRGTCSV